MATPAHDQPHAPATDTPADVRAAVVDSPTPTAPAGGPSPTRRLAQVMSEEQAARRQAWAEQVAASRAKFELPSPRHEQNSVDNLTAPHTR